MWLNDSRRLLFVHEGNLFVLDRESGESRQILSFAPDEMHSFELSEDNRTIYFGRVRAEADIWMFTLNKEK